VNEDKYIFLVVMNSLSFLPWDVGTVLTSLDLSRTQGEVNRTVNEMECPVLDDVYAARNMSFGRVEEGT